MSPRSHICNANHVAWKAVDSKAAAKPVQSTKTDDSAKKVAETKSTPKSAKSIKAEDSTMATPTKKPKTEAKANTPATEEKKSPAKRPKVETDLQTLSTAGDDNTAVTVQYDSSAKAKVRIWQGQLCIGSLLIIA